MNRLLTLLLAILLFSCAQQSEKEKDFLKYIDPQIGGIAPFLQPTRTRMHIPNSMVRVYPEREDYRDDQIRSFPLNMLLHRSNPAFNILPVSGNVNRYEHPVSAWDKELEIASPFYYSTWLEDFDITVEYTPSERAGFYRFSYGNADDKKLFLRKINGINWQMSADGSITGVRDFEGMKAFCYGRFDAIGEFEKAGDNSWINWKNDAPKINFKYGISYISLEQAKKNLDNEIPDWDFENVKKIARDKWSSVINQIQVEGGTEAYRRTFYTALYRSYERMVNISEGDKYYSNYDKSIHKGERDFYVDDWCWDTYLALHPLRYILNPEMEADMIASYIRMYEQSGWLPQFPQVFGDIRPMNGFHSTIMILDAWRKGIRDFDVNVAYQAMKRNFYDGTRVAWRTGAGCELDKFYLDNGYFPALNPGEKETVPEVDGFEKRQSVAVTLGHSYDDWALAEMAKELGKKDDYEIFSKHAQNYKNLYWEEKGFFMPKDKDGNWIDIDPKFDGGMGGRDYYDENNGWTYLWNVQQDILGLQELMGGKAIFEERLDQLFRESLGRSTYELNARFPDFTGIVGQYSMGNEPSFHIPYLYNLTNSPWKTQKKIRMLLNMWFKDNEFGIPGDEDGGGMSAFVVFSAMGFYPITPGIPVYTIGSPLFSKITINLPNGKQFIVSAPKCNETNKYIQSAKLNGEILNSPWFTHDQLNNGGMLELEMGAYPNKGWGLDSSGVPEEFK
ncbi:GH92 family glycosyl hydrolase [uncultured Draconibacterium sp.]|uniref:GH92 family glycosyl hydrolase n=1 Tax=uncultured Draconibacterium sp. TaxID=1573823 RepID=UPI0029C6483B|nr:GH92 family glycosyl hydrolase [uncultured Draconibacterium sp.]